MRYTRLVHAAGLAIVLLGTALAFAACGDDDESRGSITPTPAAYELGDIVIREPAARANPNPVSSVYLHIENRGSQADRLVSAHCALAGMTQLHEVVTEGGQSKMQEVAGGIEIPAKGHVDLQPGGLHIMLMDLERPLQEGETIQVTLRFARAGEITIDVPVRSYTNTPEAGTDGSHGSGGH